MSPAIGFLAPPGDGKTILAVRAILQILEYHPGFKVVANLKLQNIPEFEYNPFFIMDDYRNTIILIDDCYSSKGLEHLYEILVSKSRKLNIWIIYTAQYYAMIAKQARKQLEFGIPVCLNKMNPEQLKEYVLLAFTEVKLTSEGDPKPISNTVYLKLDTQRYARFYDTFEDVLEFTPRNLAKQLLVFGHRVHLDEYFYRLKLTQKEENEIMRIYRQLKNNGGGG